VIAGRGGIAGSDLSCYTAAVATLLEALGVSHQVVIGAQLYTATRVERTGSGSLLGFLHHHTSLRSASLGAPNLGRRGAGSWSEADGRLRAQVAAVGAVIVVGDTFNLPWQGAWARGHAPHWFVIDAFAGDACHVTDLFECENEFGVQPAYRGWRRVDELVELARAPDYGASPWFGIRERHALGDLEDERALTATNGYHWYEAVVGRAGRRPDPEAALAVLRDSVLHHGCRTVRADLEEPGWSCGLRALELLRSRAEERLLLPSFYDATPDLWVAGRTRSLFARTCASLGAALGDARFERLAGWCRVKLVAPWSMVPRVMEYNRGSLERGRPPRTLLLELFDRILAVESDLLSRLAPLVNA
jgi:hypothetical protein